MHSTIGRLTTSQTPAKPKREIAPKLWWSLATVALVEASKLLLRATRTAIEELTVSEVTAMGLIVLTMLVFFAALVAASRVFASFRRDSALVVAAKLGEMLKEHHLSLLVLNAELHSGTGTHHVVAKETRPGHGVVAVITTGSTQPLRLARSRKTLVQLRKDAKMLSYELNYPVVPILFDARAKEEPKETHGVWSSNERALPGIYRYQLWSEKGFERALLRRVEYAVQRKS